jgi:hypothetical protein
MSKNTITRVYSVSNIEWDIGNLEDHFEYEPETQEEVEEETASLVEEWENLPFVIDEVEVVGYETWTDDEWESELDDKITDIYGWTMNYREVFVNFVY